MSDLRAEVARFASYATVHHQEEEGVLLVHLRRSEIAILQAGLAALEHVLPYCALAETRDLLGSGTGRPNIIANMAHGVVQLYTKLGELVEAQLPEAEEGEEVAE